MKCFGIISLLLVTITACSCTFPGIFPGYPGIPLNYLETLNSPFFSVKFDQNGGVQHPEAISNVVSSYEFPQASVNIPLLPSSFPIALYLNRMVDANAPNSFESSAPKIFQLNSNPFLYGPSIGTTTIIKADQGEENSLVEIIKVDGLIPVLNDEGDKNDGDGGSGDDSDDGSCKGDCLGDKNQKEESETPEEESTEKDVEEVEKPEEKEKEDGTESKDESVDLNSGDAEEPKAETPPSINIGKLEAL